MTLKEKLLEMRNFTLDLRELQNGFYKSFFEKYIIKNPKKDPKAVYEKSDSDDFR